MRVLHLPYSYFPEPIGGTEVYVEGLARELAARGVVSTIAFASQDSAAVYQWSDVPVHRMRVAASAGATELYGAGRAEAIAAYLRVWDDVRPDVVHVHAYTPCLNGRTIHALRERGARIVVTYHTPTVTCQRGTLLRFGKVVCDGRLIVDRCSACVLQKEGVPRPFADVLAHLPPAVGRGVSAIGGESGYWTALRMTELMRIRHQDARRFLDVADFIVAPTTWVESLLVANEVSRTKIVISAQGVDSVAADSKTRCEVVARVTEPAPGPLRIVLPARLDPTKGIHVVLAALALIPTAPVTLDIFGNAEGNDRYLEELRSAVSADRRVRLLPPFERSRLHELLTEYDVMAVPSQSLETGPLVILEAQSVGLPTIGSAVGGITDKIEDGINGKLVVTGSPRAWAEIIAALSSDRTIIAGWRAAVTTPRTMAAVAADMHALYDRVATLRPTGLRE